MYDVGIFKTFCLQVQAVEVFCILRDTWFFDLAIDHDHLQSNIT